MTVCSKTSWSFLDKNLSFLECIDIKIKKARIGISYHVRPG